jgi:6-pyruvoyltetrahydropterin/6-carboxytetrahydropterin synthase
VPTSQGPHRGFDAEPPLLFFIDVYELTVRTCFAAAHAIVMAGVREPMHGHNWEVVVGVEGERLDADGLLCDFHAVETALAGATAPFRNRTLNEVPPFDTVNPTAELVARHLGEEMVRRLASTLASTGARVAFASVTEAPGCIATWRAARPTARGLD